METAPKIILRLNTLKGVVFMPCFHELWISFFPALWEETIDLKLRNLAPYLNLWFNCLSNEKTCKS